VDRQKLRLVALVLAGLADQAQQQQQRMSRARLYQLVESAKRDLGSRTVEAIRRRAREHVARTVYRELCKLYASPGAGAAERGAKRSQDSGDPAQAFVGLEPEVEEVAP